MAEREQEPLDECGLSNAGKHPQPPTALSTVSSGTGMCTANSSGSAIKRVVPSHYGVSGARRTLPPLVSDKRSSERTIRSAICRTRPLNSSVLDDRPAKDCHSEVLYVYPEVVTASTFVLFYPDRCLDDLCGCDGLGPDRSVRGQSGQLGQPRRRRRG